MAVSKKRPKPARKKIAPASKPAQPKMLQRLFKSLQQQLDDFEQRETSTDNPERDAKMLIALAGALERLTAMDLDMKKTKQDKKHAAKPGDSEAIIRALCQRFERLSKSTKPAESAAKTKTRRA